ncbi:uncharacterized, partial [Tachysurus ichikawai]
PQLQSHRALALSTPLTHVTFNNVAIRNAARLPTMRNETRLAFTQRNNTDVSHANVCSKEGQEMIDG